MEHLVGRAVILFFLGDWNSIPVLFPYLDINHDVVNEVVKIVDVRQ
jgi:hypothetical protein